MENADNNSEEEILHELGAFPPALAKRILDKLEAGQIPFETEIDNSALSDPSRSLKLSIGMPTEGSKIEIFVPESSIARAQEVVKNLFPE